MKLIDKIRNSHCWYTLSFLWKEARVLVIQELFNETNGVLSTGLRFIVTGLILKNIEQGFLLEYLNKYLLLIGAISLGYTIVVSQISLAFEIRARRATDMVRSKIEELITLRTLQFDLDRRMTLEFIDHRRAAKRCDLYDMKTLALAPADASSSVIKLVLFLSSLTWLNWKITLGLLLFGIATFFLHKNLNLYMRSSEERMDRIQDRLSEYTGVVSSEQVTLLGIRRVLIDRIQYWKKCCLEETLTNLRKNKQISGYLGIGQVVVGTLCVFYIAQTIKGQGIFEIGMIVTAAQGAIRAVKDLGRTLSRYSNNLTDVERFRAFMEMPTLDAGRKDEAIITKPGSNLEISNTSFSYPRATKPAIDGISLTLRAGESTVIVGANGSGKSTLLSIACQLLRPQQGSVHLDGVNLGEYRTTRCVEAITFVPQKGGLAEIPLVEAMFGELELDQVDPVRLKNALEWSGADRVIPTLRHGLKTHIGHHFDESQGVSGGQEQRLRLAAYLYHAQRSDVRAFFADEPSRYLDAEARGALYRAMRSLAALGKIVIVVAHDADLTVFDRVVLLRDGKIVQDLRGSDNIARSVDSIARILAGDTE